MEEKTLGEVLEEARINAEMNLRMAAEALVKEGVFQVVDHSSISRYESGKRLPKLTVLLGLCQVYGIKPSLVLSRAGLDKVKAPLEKILRERSEDVEIGLKDGENTRCMVYIPDTLREESGELAHARGSNFSEMVRTLLRRELRAHVSRLSRRALG